MNRRRTEQVERDPHQLGERAAEHDLLRSEGHVGEGMARQCHERPKVPEEPAAHGQPRRAHLQRLHTSC